MPKKKTQEEFINEANLLHENRYDYSKVKYINNLTEVEIICKEHGSFWQLPKVHLRKCDCPICAGNKKLTTEEFIKRAIQIHGNKYDYSKSVYINCKTPMIIICPIHGDFLQTSNDHISSKCGCAKCSCIGQSNTQEFIEKAQKLYGDLYDYSKVEYVKSCLKVIIICKKHGEFLITPNGHIEGGGCKKCANEDSRLTKEEFIQKAIQKHGDNFDYSQSNFITTRSIISIKCKVCGSIFNKRAWHHLSNGCKVCSKIKCTKTLENFIKDAQEVHGNLYDYSEAIYINTKTKLKIKCKHHNNFFLQTPANHLVGSGCPICSNSKGELVISKILQKNNIDFECHKTFEDCRNIYPLRFDFYISSKRIIIEYDGEQHFKSFKHFGGEERFLIDKQRDCIKDKYCLDNNIKMIRIPYFKTNKEIEDILLKGVVYVHG